MTETVDNSELPEHEVAIAVFVKLRAYDQRDAANTAEVAIRQALGGDTWMERSPTIEFRSVRHTVPVHVGNVMDVGTAARNGYLSVRPSTQAFRSEG
jgi:hypothetical protein